MMCCHFSAFKRSDYLHSTVTFYDEEVQVRSRMAAGSCQKFSHPPSSDEPSLGLELFDQKHRMAPVCYLRPRAPLGSAELCTSLLSCLRSEGKLSIPVSELTSLYGML